MRGQGRGAAGNCGCGLGAGRAQPVGAAVGACGDPAPVFPAGEDVLDPVASSREVEVFRDTGLAVPAEGDAGLNMLFDARAAEPAGITAAIRKHGSEMRRRNRAGPRSAMVAGLPGAGRPVDRLPIHPATAKQCGCQGYIRQEQVDPLNAAGRTTAEGTAGDALFLRRSAGWDPPRDTPLVPGINQAKAAGTGTRSGPDCGGCGLEEDPHGLLELARLFGMQPVPGIGDPGKAGLGEVAADPLAVFGQDIA